MDSRAQTPQDFTVGVSVLLVTVIGVIAFVQGGALAVYESPNVQTNQPTADRVATFLVENHTVDGTRNHLVYNASGGINESLNEDTDELERLKENAGLDVATERRANPRVNVTIVNGTTLAAGLRVPAVDDNGQRFAWGPSAADRTNLATSSRVVKLTNATGQCDPVCWLVVRVW